MIITFSSSPIKSIQRLKQKELQNRLKTLDIAEKNICELQKILTEKREEESKIKNEILKDKESIDDIREETDEIKKEIEFWTEKEKTSHSLDN
jgi:uncharacterized protein YlxW (UPF0749 family)